MATNHLLAFHPRFVPLIRDGRKRQTFREARGGRVKPDLGDTVACVEALQPTIGIGAWVVDRVMDVRIDLKAGRMQIGEGELLEAEPNVLEALALQDGFTCWADMRSFLAQVYRSQAVINGWVVGWDFKQGSAA